MILQLTSLFNEELVISSLALTLPPFATRRVTTALTAVPSDAATLDAQRKLQVEIITATELGDDESQFTADETTVLKAVAAAYEEQAATWYAGSVNSTVTPSVTADGDITTGTDLVPLKWLVVLNAEDDVAAAQQLLDEGPNVHQILLGAPVEQIPMVALDGVTPEILTTVHAVCVSATAAPGSYTGGAYMLSQADTAIANALANMVRFDFDVGLGATVARFTASPVYNTNYSQLSVAAGVVA